MTTTSGLTILRGVSRYVLGAARTAPTITSDGGGSTAAVSVNTGDTDVTTVTATGTAPVTFYIQGGANASLFQIDAALGTLSFIDTSVDGAYVVIIGATNLAGADTQTITATVSSGSYHADAVHFAVDSFMRVTDQDFVAVNGTQITVSFWTKIADISDFPVLFSIYGYPGGSGVWDVTFFVGYNFTSDLAFVVAAGTTSPVCAGGSADGLFTTDTWHHVLFSIDTNYATGLKPTYFYVDGVDVLDPSNNADGTGAFTIPLNGFTAITEGGSIASPRKAYDIADVQVFAQLIDVSNPTNLAKFIAGGKPVDPAIAAAAFGQQQIFLTGDATAFQENGGTWNSGNIITVTGTITNASTSPSD